MIPPEMLTRTFGVWREQSGVLSADMVRIPDGLVATLLVFGGCIPMTSSAGALAGEAKTAEKELYLPKEIWRVPKDNDFKNDASEFSFKRMIQSPDIAIFWSKEFGDNPMANPDASKRFDGKEALRECDRFYDFYVNRLKMVQKGKSLTDRYKILFFVIGGDEGTAFGGGADDKIGVLWTPASRMSKAPYGALAHELGHAFQYLSEKDSGHGLGGGISEMTAQYMLWQVYPEWMTFENYHLKDFMKQTHLAFLHPANIYHSPYVFEYWSGNHGLSFYADLCRAAERGDDAVLAYKRVQSVDQQQFNDRMFDACRHFITWDMKRVEKVAEPYANQHTTKLEAMADGSFRISKDRCPEDYGYNGIQLQVPAKGTTVKLAFKGIAGINGFSKARVDHAGWRYGFVAYTRDKTRVYSDPARDAAGKLEFTVPANTEYLWLVVMGAPSEHVPLAQTRRRQAAATSTEHAQWPYDFRIEGTSPIPAIVTPATASP